MTFKDNLNRLCAIKGTYLTTMIKDLGFSSSKATAINNGQIPNNEDTLLRISRYLGCSVMDLFADDEISNAQTEDEIDILTIYRSLSNKERHKFMTMIYSFEKK